MNAAAEAQQAQVILGPILTLLLETIGAILSALAAAYTPTLVAKLSTWLHIKINAAATARITSAVDNAITYAVNTGTRDVSHLNIPVKDPQVATAANYVISKMPGTLKQMGIDITTDAGQQQVADLVLARIPPPPIKVAPNAHAGA